MSHGTLFGTLHGAEADEALSIIDGIDARLYEQFKESPNVTAVANWLAEQFQLMEEILHDLIWFRYVNVAQGAVLDGLLANWGRTRSGLTDAQAQALLKALHPGLFQHPTPDVIIGMANAILIDHDSTTAYADDFPAGFILCITGVPSADAADLNPFIRIAKGEGVRMQTKVVTTPAAAFQFDTGLGYDQGVYAHSLE